MTTLHPNTINQLIFVLVLHSSARQKHEGRTAFSTTILYIEAQFHVEITFK